MSHTPAGDLSTADRRKILATIEREAIGAHSAIGHGRTGTYTKKVAAIRRLLALLDRTGPTPEREEGTPTNAERAEWGREALRHFAALVGQTEEDGDTNLGDLLADLLHTFGEPRFADAMRRGKAHYDAEVLEEAEGRR